jgi:hypothetical protein
MPGALVKPRHLKRAQFRNDVTSWWRGHALDISRRSRRSSTQGCRPDPQPMERILAQNLLVRRDDRGPSYHYTARSSTSFGNHTPSNDYRPRGLAGSSPCLVIALDGRHRSEPMSLRSKPRIIAALIGSVFSTTIFFSISPRSRPPRPATTQMLRSCRRTGRLAGKGCRG